MDHQELKSENKEYKLRLQSLEQQSQLKDGMHVLIPFTLGSSQLISVLTYSYV